VKRLLPTLLYLVATSETLSYPAHTRGIVTTIATSRAKILAFRRIRCPIFHLLWIHRLYPRSRCII
jgi:hypothetical protein